MKKVAVLGGGMAGLAAAWSLSAPECRGEIEVTVYQRGWRLGGKGASSRGVNGRIEEHGLHVWLGYYDNAFRLMRQVYRELDRPVSDPSCVIPGFARAFAPTAGVGIGDNSQGTWSHWIATFSSNRGEPGKTATNGTAQSSVLVFLRRALTLLMDFAASLPGKDAPVIPQVVLSGSPDPPAAGAGTTDRMLRQAEFGALIGALETLRLVGGLRAERQSPAGFVLERLKALQADIARRLGDNDDSRRAADLADLVTTCVRGAIVDELLANPEGLAAIDHLDLREWLRRHGATERTCNSALIKGLYDLAFAYQDGDFAKPVFSAGQGLFLAGKMFFDYQGSIFWHMQAGMGDIVFAPLYQALKSRGVRFEFFHRVDQVHVDDDGRSVAAVTIGRQASLSEGAEYQPLVRVGDLPCFPDAPIAEQLTRPVAADLEKHWSDRSSEHLRRLEAGVDFDAVVIAVSIGMIPHTCSELLEASPRWRAMVDAVSTVPTQSLQLWFRRTEQELGWPHPGATVSGYLSPFDTYASMSHLIPRESWPAESRPRSIAYFCSALPEEASDDPDIAHKLVRGNAADLLSRRVAHFWPAAAAPDGGFSWDVLHATAPVGDENRAGDESLLDSQYWRANIDPSDRYVQSVPGSLAFRLRADESGYHNLFLAGDWINNGHNGGCIEAAVISGMQAANAVRGRRLTKGIRGDYPLKP